MQIYALWPDVKAGGLFAGSDTEYARLEKLLGKPAAYQWSTPSLVCGNYNPPMGYLSLRDIELRDTIEPILSPKAHGVLQNILDPWIELLPVMIPGGEKWFLCNFTQTLDVLDHERSEILRWPTLGNIRGIPKYVFHEDRLQGVSLFRIPERPVVVFATECFADKVRTAGLTGLDFRNPDEKWHGTAGPKGRLPG